MTTFVLVHGAWHGPWCWERVTALLQARGIPFALVDRGVGTPRQVSSDPWIDRERVQAAVKNAGLFFPRRRLVVNLAPAAVRKEGPAYDLPIALARRASIGVSTVSATVAIAHLAGIRTFALITVLGAVAALLSLGLSPWIMAAGFVAVAAFMCVYYMLFGVFSSVALGVNLLLLVAILSMLQATLTLPGMAAMALVLGMAIDANVLINERVREELRNGVSPQAAIHAGYDRAWATILDSNVTTLIAGLALLAFGSGPVRGFAVVHCIGIVTSMFSAVFFSRGLVNLWYGRQKKLQTVSIGTVWRPDAGTAVTPRD